MLLHPLSMLKSADAGGSPAAVTDDFNRANSSGLGANWTDLRDQWDISSNTAAQPTPTTSTTSVYTGTSFAANQYAQCSSAVIVPGGAGPVLRAVDASNFIYAFVNNTSWQIWKKVAGSDTQVGSTGTASLSPGDVMYMEVSGDTVTLKKGGSGGTTQATGSLGGDLSSTGSPGINCYCTGAGGVAVDNFEAGDL